MRPNYYGKKTLTSRNMKFLEKKKHTKYYYSSSVFNMVGKTENVFVFLDLRYD